MKNNTQSYDEFAAKLFDKFPRNEADFTKILGQPVKNLITALRKIDKRDESTVYESNIPTDCRYFVDVRCTMENNESITRSVDIKPLFNAYQQEMGFGMKRAAFELSNMIKHEFEQAKEQARENVMDEMER